MNQTKRTRRTTLLLNRQPRLVEFAMAHPKQHAHVAVVAELIGAVRQARSDEDLIQLQEDLLQRMLAAQAEQASAKRQWTRAKHLKNPDPAAAQLAEVDLVVADRIVRQLRSIGDAIAWHAARFHRQTFVVGAHESGGGPMYDKAGWIREVARARQIWNTDGEVAIINGITNCLRAADVTVFGSSGVRLEEVKSKVGSRRAGQKARWRQLESAINNGSPYSTPDGKMQVWESAAQLRTRVKTDLQAAIQDADRVGTSTRQLGEGWFLLCTTREGYRRNRSLLTRQEMSRRRAEAIRAANMGNSAQPFIFTSVDAVSRAAWSAPFSIFPLSPTDCARLICDYAVYESAMSFERFRDAITATGLEVVHHPPPTGSSTNPGGSLFATLKLKTLVLPLRTTTLNQIVIELVDPKVYARALAETMKHPLEQGSAGTFVFANEKAAWR